MENGMQTVIRGASQLTVTRSRMAPGSSAGTGGRRTSRLPVEAVQPPCHLFRRDIEAGLLPYAATYHIGVLAHGPLAHGLLGGTLTEATTFGADDWRSHSPALTGPGIRRNLNPAHRPRRRSPAQARSQEHSSASAASRPTALYSVKLTLFKNKLTVALMKHYGHTCAIARALDVIGERWNLLIVRELTLGPRRYR